MIRTCCTTARVINSRSRNGTDYTATTNSGIVRSAASAATTATMIGRGCAKCAALQTLVSHTGARLSLPSSSASRSSV